MSQHQQQQSDHHDATINSNHVRKNNHSSNLTGVDFATCCSLCERYYVMSRLQSVKKELAIMAIDCILNGIVDCPVSSSSEIVPSQEEWQILKVWGLVEVIQFAHEYYHDEYLEFQVSRKELVEVHEPQLKKVKRNHHQHHHLHSQQSSKTTTCVNMDISRYERVQQSFYHALEIMREIIEKDQTSHDDLTLAIENVYRQHLIKSVPYFESCYRKNPLFEKFYYHILELYKQTDQKIESIKYVEFGLLYNGRQVQILESMLNNVLRFQQDKILSHTFLQKHLRFRKAHQKCLEGILLFFCDCTDMEAMVRVFEESYALDPSFIYAYGNIGYLKGFNVMGNREITEEGLSNFYKVPELCTPSDELFLKINSIKTIGVIQMISGNFQEALAHFSKCLQIFPDYYQIYKDRAVAFSLHDTTQAIKDIEKCFEIKPDRNSDMCALLVLKAVLFHKMKRPQEEITPILENAMAIDPTNSYPFQTLSSLAIQEEDLDRYLELRSKFKPLNDQSVLDLLNQDIKAFEVFDQFYDTNLENEYKSKKKQHVSTWFRIS